MTITEAAACATPAVATNVPGHSDAVVDGVTGLLADGPEAFRGALDSVLRDDDAARPPGRGAREHAERYTWAATARGTLEVLAAAAIARRGRPERRPVIARPRVGRRLRSWPMHPSRSS